MCVLNSSCAYHNFKFRQLSLWKVEIGWCYLSVDCHVTFLMEYTEWSLEKPNTLEKPKFCSNDSNIVISYGIAYSAEDFS